jgi:hypothetical protein
MKNIPVLILAGIAASNSSVMVWIFWKIKFEGVYTFNEVNPIILDTEFILSIALSILAAFMFVKYWLRVIKGKL